MIGKKAMQAPKRDNVTSINRALPDHLAPVFAQFPLEVADAQGVFLHTPGGRKVLDLYGGHAVAALGYNHPRWVDAITRQARSLCFQSNAVPLDVRRRAATKLAQFCGLGLDTVFFINSGAEANENALKIACKMTGGTEVIAVEGSFHGRTAAAGAVTWGAQQKWYGFPNKPFDVKFIKPTDIDKLGSLVSDATAAVIVEPIQGVAGAVDMPKEFLEALRVRCTENGSLLIFDEVQCGVGRTGHPFAANLYGVTPDIITTAKALGAGFPVSAILVGNHIVPYLKVDSLGTTFGGGPMACAVVEAVIDIIEDENLLENVRERSTDPRHLHRRPRRRHARRGPAARIALLAPGEGGTGRAPGARHPHGHQRRSACAADPGTVRARQRACGIVARSARAARAVIR
jgi:acetylornithine/succinyldiaminopimelate/putrescine aminotransferase